MPYEQIDFEAIIIELFPDVSVLERSGEWTVFVDRDEVRFLRVRQRPTRKRPNLCVVVDRNRQRISFGGGAWLRMREAGEQDPEAARIWTFLLAYAFSHAPGLA